jgi:electron transport complex protein RnfB
LFEETTPKTVTKPVADAGAKKKKKSKTVAVIHEQGCTGCEVCIEFCPVDCIYRVPGPEHPEEQGYVSVNGVCIVDVDVCIGCKLCAKYCPWEVIDMVPREEEEQEILALQEAA